MVNNIIRLLFIVACAIMGYAWAAYILAERDAAEDGTTLYWTWVTVGTVSGIGVGGLVLYALRFITQDLFERIMPVLVSVVIAMVLGYVASQYLIAFVFNIQDTAIHNLLVATLVLVFGYIGITLGLTRASNWDSLIRAVKKRHFENGNPKIVDTSVIIDGRLADICETGFIEGTLIIPRFILHELQNIADSADDLRRARGRRGLDLLKSIQESAEKHNVDVQVVEDDPQEVSEVDSKLVHLARQYGAKILTNDLNLNKVARIEGVTVLNINDLSNAVKPAVLPDEEMHVKIVKVGKEASQGVGYLDDGTMVVVDGGKDHVGHAVSAVVTSVLQTTAGRIIFTRLRSAL